MERKYTLDELVHLAETQGSLEGVSGVIVRLYESGTPTSLDLLLNLALSDYGGITYKSDYQMISIIGTVYWGAVGLRKLGERAIANNGFRAITNVTSFLSHVSSKTLNEFASTYRNFENVQQLDLSSDKYLTEELVSTAKEVLIALIQSVEKENTFPMGIIHNLGWGANEIAQEHVFAALMARWFNFSPIGLDNYQKLVSNSKTTESEVHNFLKSAPYVLEPFHAQIWSKPKFGEKLIPDFLIRSMDNNYTIVEIEQPSFSIITKSGELSAKATHAKRQALDFRNWAINNSLYAIQTYKNIYRPFCLVVIGNESTLSAMQAERLKQENESTQGVLKIVGFDWLYARAKATFDNIVKFGFERNTFKSVS